MGVDSDCPILLLGGPTASGKSALALEWAQKKGAEIVSIDAFQVYCGMDIGTAKPSLEEQGKVRHHLIDLVPPTASFSVADYLEHATKVKEDLAARGKPSIWVGGTGLYFRALREGLCKAPASQSQTIEELEKLSTAELVAQVKVADPLWAQSADLCNRRRLVRALAVFKQTQIPLSTWHAQQTKPLLPDAPAFYLEIPAQSLKERIHARVVNMWENGWLEEVEELSHLSGWEESPSAAALGYKHVLSFLRGTIDREAAIAQIIQETEQFAKRQRTWFRSEKGLQVISRG